MSKAVAVEGDTQALTSTEKLPADTGQTGSWQADTLQVTIGKTVSVGGKKVELSAVMTWIYQGGTAGTSPMLPVTDTATLAASPTKLKDANQNVLVEGDEVTGTVDAGNKIMVTKSQDVLRTA